jgi:hypothetical protein
MLAEEFGDFHDEAPTDAGDEDITFAELLSNVMLNDEIIITILPEDVERTKTGIKNTKAKQAAKMKDDGLAVDNSVLSFIATDSKDFVGMIDLKIILARKSTVRIKQLVVPDGNF